MASAVNWAGMHAKPSRTSRIMARSGGLPRSRHRALTFMTALSMRRMSPVSCSAMYSTSSPATAMFWAASLCWMMRTRVCM